MQISRQALYRTPTPTRPPQRRPPVDAVEWAIVEVAGDNQTDGYRMVTALVRQKLRVPANRKRVLRVMRERKLMQRRRPLERRKRPGFFRVERPGQLWLFDMTSVWVGEHGWTYLNATRRSRSSNAPQCCSGSIRANSCSATTTARPSPRHAPRRSSLSLTSRTAAAATATPRAKPS